VQAVRSESLIRGYSGNLIVVFFALGQTAVDQDAFGLVPLLLGLFVPPVLVQLKPSRYRLRFRTHLWPQLQPDEIVSTSPRWSVSA